MSKYKVTKSELKFMRQIFASVPEDWWDILTEDFYKAGQVASQSTGLVSRE